MTLFALLTAGPQSILADLTPQETLKGINRVGVDVVGVTPDAEQAGLTKDSVQKEAEDYIRQSGIKVLPFRGAVDSEMALLLVRINAVQAYDAKGKLMPLFAVSGQLEVQQAVSLLRQPVYKFSATTWVRGFNMTVGKKDLKNRFLSELTELVEQFVGDFKKANSE